MKWKSTASIIDNIIKDRKSAVKDDVESAWMGMKDVSRKADIITFSDGELVLKAHNSAYLQELSMKREIIIDNLNNRLKGRVKKIKYILGG